MSEYIKREDALHELSVAKYEVPQVTAGVLRTQIRSVVNAIPAADVEPVARGEWIEFDEDMNAYSCSVCNEPQMFIEGNPEQNQYSFCPHCGAHMREKPNE